MNDAAIPFDLFADLPDAAASPAAGRRVDSVPAPDRVPAECLARVRQHDQEAARELVGLLYPLVIRIVRANLPRRASEEDLAQDIFTRIFQHLDQFQGQSPIEHWVSRIAVNHCLNAIRAQKTRPEWRMSDLSEEHAHLLEGLPGESDDSEPSRRIRSEELVEFLLESLEPEDRLVLRMLEIEDRSVEEIRVVTGWSSAMVRVRAFRARQHLNRRFGQLRREGGL
jgi:RNA polymerase sigma-70 factor (ECF subfamily)